MNFLNKKRISIAVLIILIFGSFLLISKTASKENSPPPNLPLIKEEGKAVLEIENIKYEAEITASETVYDFMDKLRREGKINFKETNYIGMGELITEINGQANSGGISWIYYVNSKQANIGVSNYKLKNGDTVSWRYQTYDEKYNN